MRSKGSLAITPSLPARGLLVSVYRRKLKRHDEVAVPYGSRPATCPVRALVAALAAASRTSGPLFVRIYRHGRQGRR
ncbi:hypothetical protein ABZ876_32795 [Streptomyces sp. NPDC046931]|uniref:hypothetical protein n=1 Tax=Streptomyces sp. NPDC046931 TaxID=3154806 RepID=UPI0033FE2E96